MIMNKFWKWIEDKGYGKNYIDGFSIDRAAYWEDEDIPKQMLIGYMFEYLIERYEGIADVDLAIGDSIEDFYNSLKENILELDR